MGEFEDKVNRILSDPDQMDKIANLAKSLMGGDSEESTGRQEAPSSFFGGEGLGLDAAMLGKISRLLQSGAGQNREKEALFAAMKPYLSEKRRAKMDKAIKIAGLARLARIAMGEMGERDV